MILHLLNESVIPEAYTGMQVVICNYWFMAFLTDHWGYFKQIHTESVRRETYFLQEARSRKVVVEGETQWFLEIIDIGEVLYLGGKY